MDFLAVVFADRDCRAASIVAGFHALAGAAAGGDADVVFELDVAEDAGLTAEHDMLACLGGTCDACLGGDDVMLPDLDVVGDLDEIVDFRAFADDGLFEARTIDGGVGADLDVVFEDYIAELLELDEVALSVREIAEAAGADDGTWLENDSVAKNAPLTDAGERVKQAVLTDRYLKSNRDVGTDDGVIVDQNALIDDYVGADRDVGADLD